jgi:hypothetical protein
MGRMPLGVRNISDFGFPNSDLGRAPGHSKSEITNPKSEISANTYSLRILLFARFQDVLGSCVN